MKVFAIEVLCDNRVAKDELLEQLEQQCIQTVEYSVDLYAERQYRVRVIPYFADHLDPQLLELFV